MDKIESQGEGTPIKQTRKRPGRPKLIDVICVRSFGIEDKTDPTGVRMIKPREIVKIPIDLARKFQDRDVIKVVIHD